MKSLCTRGSAPMLRRLVTAGMALTALFLAPGYARAQIFASTTTTTALPGTTTTTLFIPVDVSGGGDFEGSFPAGSFDTYTFELDDTRVLLAETTNGFGGCPGDTIITLRHAGVGGTCTAYGDDLPCIAFDDDSGISLCSRLEHRLPAGQYDIRVSTYGGKKLNRYFLHVGFFQTECGNHVVEIGEQCDDGNTTGGDCCSAGCQREAQGSPCNDGLFCNGADSCSATGFCTQHSGVQCPGTDGDSNCAESCSDAAGGCTGPDPNGSPCDDGIFCNGTDTCSNGSCSVHAGNPCAGPDGDGDCSESCSEEAKACTAKDPNGSACNDTEFCNGADSCSNGSCSQHAGNPCAGPDGDANCAESCNEANDSCTANDPAGAPCNDGQFCNGPDTCVAGACSSHAGNPCDGPDGDSDCSETCDEVADACTGSDPEGTVCDDGLTCNGADTCHLGECSVHVGVSCPGADGDADCSESCSDSGSPGCTNPDPNGSACDDGIFCNGADTCSNGTCSHHAGSPCAGPDNDANCTESCSEELKTCTAADPDNAPCNDGLFCNGADACSNGSCSVHPGNPCDGPDGDADCSETCSEQAKACSANDPNGSACDDAVFCNGADTCSNGSCSQHAGNPCAGPDGDGNCAESCNEAGDSCSSNDPNGSPCNDGLFCNGTDTCLGGACSSHSGNPCDGPDGDIDCSETCDDVADACTGADPEGSDCNDGLACDGVDKCHLGECSVHVGLACPGNDGDANCSESCSDNGLPGCTNPDPDGIPCDDGIFCNGIDTCLGGACSQHAGSPCPGPDNDANCSESCNEQAKSCSAHDPTGSACNDDDPCTQTSTCSSAGVCTGAATSDCDDHDACTTDACTEGPQHCSHTPIPDCTSTTTTTTTTSLPPGSICGDVSGDGIVKASDALTILKAAVGGSQCSGGKFCICDANGNGTLSATDALITLKRAVDAGVSLACKC